jgi:hypothetical protein
VTFRLSGGGEGCSGLTRETIEDGFAGGDFDEMEDGQCQQDQDGIGEPRIQSGKVETFGQVVGVDELKDVKVKEIETVTALANEKKGTPGEERGDGMRAAKSKNEGGEDGSHEAAVH